MKKTALTKFDRIMAAAAFAEEGEFNTAREFLRENDSAGKRATNRPEQRKKQQIQKAR